MYQLLVKLRSAILVFLTHHMALPLLKLVRNEEKFPYSLPQLIQMTPASLGYTLGSFLYQKKLQLLPYYARHDIKHILLEYDTTDEGEVCLQCFMLGNRHVSFPVLATVVYGFVTMPEHWTDFKKAVRRGRQAPSLRHWQWYTLLAIPVSDLRQQINQLSTDV
jgi:hypothetical protein